MDTFSGHRHLRALLLGTVVTAGMVGVARLTHPVLTAPATDFASMLTRGCALAALIAAFALWVATAEVVLGVLSGRLRHSGPIGPVRATLLAACGVAVLATPAQATTIQPSPTTPGPAWGTVVAIAADRDAGDDLAGLPLPDRPTSEADSPPAPPDRVVVQPGDSLWAIAETRLPTTATVAEVASYVARLYRHNVGVIGDDPDLIHPGQVLRLPLHDERTQR